MPVADLPLRYRSKLGAPNGILTPPDDIAPYGLDPDYAGAQDLSTDAPDIPNQANIPAPPDDATEAEQANSVALPSLSTKDKLPKRLPKPSMLPPEESEPPTAPMPATPPIPQALQPQAPPAATLPSVELGDMDHTPATGGNPVDRSPVKAKDDDDDSATDKLGALKAPDAPSNNWAQRLGLAVLSLTRFAPVANQLMHPKYAEQRRAYETQREDLEQSQKEDIAASQAEALEEQRQATAAQKMAQAANYGQTQDTRKYAANDRLEAAFEKAMGPDAVQLGPNDQVPPGFTAFNSPSNQKWARRSPFVTVPQELAKEFPGLPPGSQITRAELDKALQSARAKDLASVQAGNKADNSLSDMSMAARAVGLDPSDSKNWTPEQSQAVLKEAEKHKQALHVTVNSGGGPALTPDSLDSAARKYNATGVMSSMGLGKSGRNDRVAIMNRAAEIALQEGGVDVATNMATYKALAGSLTQLQKQYGMTSAFEKNTKANMDLLKSASQATDRTGVPLLNKYLLAVKSNVFGDPDAAKLNDAVKTVANEVAKIRSGQQSGASTDSARAEAMDSIHAAMTQGQLNAVLDQMVAEMGNRTNNQLSEIDRTRANIAGLSKATGAKPTGGGGGQYTAPVSERAVRQHAIEIHADPDATVQEMKRRGIPLVP